VATGSIFQHMYSW